ncbi:hypothetical protein [Amycolatopsis decaplanina]|uniref:Uncharacterized protein n=1 Tax=Amycolatopsis decaplanina DSM 44594 TaxID=1284240 RepID=M2Z9T5_9PSEU|nr:hypothetical protein [Amycolatopsis decaplanina]EME64062.1 hypothetical protein H074_03369 [Amycolatopsis decaplanina DSM 44594]
MGTMKITLVAAACNNGRTCPNINTSDRDTVVVQGYLADRDSVPGLVLSASDAVVEIPIGLLPDGLVAADTRMYPTGRGTLLVVGPRVVDAEALAELQLPEGEDAVEVSAAPGRIPAHAG